MESPLELRRRAEHYRRLAWNLTDRQAIEALKELAEEYEALAEALDEAGRAPETQG